MNYEKYREKAELLNVLFQRKEKVLFQIDKLLGDNQDFEKISNLYKEINGLNFLISKLDRDIKRIYG
jgi:hypothetical protein